MKNIYILKTTAMNGTVTMLSHSDIFLSKELAEKCQKVVDEKNKENETTGWHLISKIEEGKLYECEDDCEILKEEKINN